MSLRSSFELSSGGDDDWHSSERGELVVRSGGWRCVGGRAGGDSPGATTTLNFQQGGALAIDGASAGLWRFWPGSMELNLSHPDGMSVQERIWFTRANLRLRSTTATDRTERRCRAVSARTSAGCPKPPDGDGALSP